jgi:hypothetical protein
MSYLLFPDKAAAKPPKVCEMPVPPIIGHPEGMTLEAHQVLPGPHTGGDWYYQLTVDRNDYGAVQFNLTWSRNGDPFRPAHINNHSTIAWDVLPPITVPVWVTVSDATGKVLGTAMANLIITEQGP